MILDVAKVFLGAFAFAGLLYVSGWLFSLTGWCSWQTAALMILAVHVHLIEQLAKRRAL